MTTPRIGLLAGTLLAAVPVTAALPVAQVQAQAVLSSYTVSFALGSAALDAAARETVAQAAAAFRAGEPTRIELVGHADTTGNADFNQQLSARRADAVRAALITAGVPSGAIAVDAVGDTRLIVPTGPNVAEAANRVVVVDLIGPEEPPPPPAPAAEPAPAAPWFAGLAFAVGPFYGFDTESDGHWLGGNLTVDYFVTDNISIGGEQAVFYAFDQNNDRDSGVGGRSVASVDYHFDFGGFEPYVGANAGGVYGTGLEDAFVYGPEVGFRLFGLEAKVAYDIRDSGLDESVVAATLGWGLRF